MKKFLSIFIVCALITTLGFTEIKNVKISGSVETLSINLDNAKDLTKTDADTGVNDDLVNQTRTRLQLGISADITDKVSGKVLVYKNDRLFGTDEQDVNSVLGLLKIANAYVTIEDVVLNGLKLTLGRQFIGSPENPLLYFGPLSNYAMTVLALDGVKAEYKNDLGSVEVVNAKKVENGVNAGNKDEDLLLLQLGTDKLIPSAGLNLVYGIRTINNPVKDNVDSLNLLGLSVNGMVPVVEGLNYKLLYALNMGKQDANVDYAGNALVVGVGYKPDLDFGKINLALEYASGSGDDGDTADKDENFYAFDNDYRYGEIFGKNGIAGNADGTGIARITNLTVLALNASVSPSMILDGKLSLGVGYYSFALTKVPSGAENALGNEIDVNVGYALTDNVGLSLVYGIFTPGDALKSTGEDAANVLSAKVNIKF